MEERNVGVKIVEQVHAVLAWVLCECESNSETGDESCDFASGSFNLLRKLKEPTIIKQGLQLLQIKVAGVFVAH